VPGSNSAYSAAAPPGRRHGPGPNLEADPEAALRALRESPDDDAVRRRAVEALEALVQRLKERAKPETAPGNPQRE
jgi:hypothetical protein